MNVRLAKLRKMDEQLERNDIQGARATLHSVMPRKISDKKKATRARKRADTSAKAEKHRMSTKEIRAACVERAYGQCEFCYAHSVAVPIHMHHLEGGSGRRREKQAISNCVMLCRDCHRKCHAYPQDVRWLVESWAERYGYPVPSRFNKGRAERRPQSTSSQPVRRGV